MAGVNRCILVGNVGRDPDVRVEGAELVGRFSLATTERFGERERTEWHRVVARGDLAGRAQDDLWKGSSAYVEGVVRTRKDGRRGVVTEIEATRIAALDELPAAMADEPPAPGFDAEGAGDESPRFHREKRK